MSKDFPFEKQPDSMDCGPLCIKMIAKFYHKIFSLDNIRKLCYSSRDGVSLLAISEAAEQLGFKTIGGKISYDRFIHEVPLPCIVHWNQEHFVVVYKIKQKSLFKWKTERIHVADPSCGLLAFSGDEFKDHWVSTRSDGKDKGIVLLLEPTPLFYKRPDEKVNSRSIRFLFSYFFKYKKFFGQLLSGLLLGSLFQLIFPFLTQSIVDIGISDQNISFIYLVLLAQLILTISRISVDFIRKWILLHIGIRINISLISDFLIKLMKLPMSFFDIKLMGDILQRIEDHERVERFLTVKTLETIFSLFNLLIFGIVLWVYNLKIFLIFLTGSIFYTAWIFLFLQKRRELDYKFFELRAKKQSNTYQLISGMQEIKLQNCEKRKRWQWEDIQAELFHINIASLSLEQKQEIGKFFINETKNIIITVMCAMAVINHELTLGMMLAIQYIIGQLNLPIEQTVAFIHDLQDTKISLERINEIHQKDDENKNRMINGDQYDIKNKDILVKNLTFQYEGPHSSKVLDNINLLIPEGKVTAIVGSSGSGKTTLVKMLLQYYQPVYGSIIVGSNDLNDFNTVWWRNQCGALMQDGYIFSESIAANIALSDEINKDNLLNSVKIANIQTFIEELPLRYNTKIGNEGQNISQGQKQRILIARAVYKNPDFIFFDEATNALDANNELAIINNLEKFYRGKTVVIVAHRLSTVKNADQIVVLEKGRIIETGTHKELTMNKGAYYHLVKNQLELGS